MTTGERISADTAARRLGISLRTLWRWRDAGKISEAGRTGNAVLFYVRDVDRLRGVDTSNDVDLAGAYVRLSEAKTWEDVEGLRQDIAGTLCRHATGDGAEAVKTAWHAACGMAAHAPDAESRDRHVMDARKYGAWLGMDQGETDREIARRGRLGTFETYESATAQARKATEDPAMLVALAEASGGAVGKSRLFESMSDNCG